MSVDGVERKNANYDISPELPTPEEWLAKYGKPRPPLISDFERRGGVSARQCIVS